MSEPLAGIVAPILTPFEDDGGGGRDLHVQHAHWVLGPIPAMKALLAVVRGDRLWCNVLPPLVGAEPAAGEALLAALGPAADHLRRIGGPA